MLFNSFPFIVFLPIVFVIYWLVGQRYRWIILLSASYYFYSGWGIQYTLLLLFTTLVDFFMALKIARAKTTSEKKLFLTISLLSNLSVLAGFKYSVFFYNSGAFVANHFFSHQYNYLNNFIIPVGLSFYTFQSIAYTMDVYRDEVIPERNLGRFALFVSFFPQLVAGPVERFSKLMPQLYRPASISFASLYPAIRIGIWGFFKKMVIADRLAEIVDPIFKNVHSYSGSTLLFSGFLFVVQVYCDFSGYTDIATGVARLFGVELILNWRRPLLSKSLVEFWTRNHISVTSWFRNYLYIPLGGNRVSYKRWLFNIFLVFLISGLWHGANWTFILWGAMHGCVYIIELVVNKKFPHIKFPAALGHIYLLLFHTISLIAFRSHSVNDLFTIYQQIFSSFHPEALKNELLGITDVFPLILNISLIGLLFLKEIQEENSFIEKASKAYVQIFRPAFYILLFIGIFLFGNFNCNQFIYFRF